MKDGIERIGKERLYNNNFENKKDIVHWEVLSIKHEQEFNLRILSTNSEYRQGIRLAIDAGEGYVEINGIKEKELYLWEDTIPENVHVKCVSTLGLLSIYNVYDMGGGRKRSLMDFGGMLVKQNDNKVVYRCNDKQRIGNFDNLIFEIEML